MYNKEDYRANKKAVIDHFEKKGMDAMSDYSAMTGIPIIIVYQYIEEDFPEHREEAQRRIQVFKDFFRIK